VTKVPSTRRGSGDRGAALVEFGLVAPVLFLLIFGIIEFGWAFSQFLDVRHGAREAARLAAVNYKSAPTDAGSAQSQAIIIETCARLSNPDGARVTLTLQGSTPADRAIGRPVTIEVTRELDTLTGFLDFALKGRTLTSSATTRLEQTATWNSYTDDCP